MFQVPVENPECLRGVRPWVKSALGVVGLESCAGLLEDLRDFYPGDSYFRQTAWRDVAPGPARGRRRGRYRSQPYCCGLCRYSARMLTAHRNHLRRCHEDEADQELLVACPDCAFCSRPRVVSEHFRLFHERPPAPGEGGRARAAPRSDGAPFTCLKCGLCVASYGSMKKHVLTTHFQHLLNAYVGQGAEDAAAAAGPSSRRAPFSGDRTPAPERYYCKKCSADPGSQDDLIDHILTSDVHRDVEMKLKSVISEQKRPWIPKQMHAAPKARAGLAAPPNGNAPGTSRPILPQNGQGLAAVQPVSAAPVQLVTQSQPATTSQVQPVASGTSWSVTSSLSAAAAAAAMTTTAESHSLPAAAVEFHSLPPPAATLPAATPSHVAVVPSTLPVGQSSLALQPPPPSAVSRSCEASPNQLVDPSLLPVSQPLGPVSKSVGMSVLPRNQVMQPGSLPLTQSIGPPSRLGRPNILPAGLAVKPGVLQNASPGLISVGQLFSFAVLPSGQATPTAVIPGQTAASGVLPPGQLVQSGVLHVGQTAPSQVLPSGLTLPFRVLPAGQMVPSGLLSSNQLAVSGIVPVNQSLNSNVLQLGQPTASGVLPVGQLAKPGMLKLSQPVGTSILPVNQPVRAETSQNTTKSGTALRKLLPTGTQVNGKPTCTFSATPVALPIPPSSGLVTVTPSQVPIQFLPLSVSTQVASSQSNSTSQQGPTNMLVQVTSSEADMNLVLGQTKQWKTCSDCNVSFPSNIYQAHVEETHKQNESNSSEKLEPEKLAVCAPFLKWTKENSHCLSCKCLVSEEELMCHLLMHGLGCLFCPVTFHNIHGLSEHLKIKHFGKKKLSLDYSNRGFQLNLDCDGNLLFPHLDFTTTLPKEMLGEREVCLAILSGTHSQSLVPLYVKVLPQANIPNLLSQEKLMCPFCFSMFMIADAYKLHLKETHHVIPVMTRQSLSFKCVHCCGVYTGNLTQAAITVHLVHCRNAPKVSSSCLQIHSAKVSSSDLQVHSTKVSSSDLQDYSREVQLGNRETILDSICPVEKKWSDGHLEAENQRDREEPLLVLKTSKEGNSSVPLKGQSNESTTEGLVVKDDLLKVLALDPKNYKGHSYEKKIQFLRDYFHKKPYPSRKEIELLSSLLLVWKINVASFFGKRRYICMKAIKTHRPSVLLGFDMSELKNVKHRLNFEYEPQKSA